MLDAVAILVDNAVARWVPVLRIRYAAGAAAALALGLVVAAAVRGQARGADEGVSGRAPSGAPMSPDNVEPDRDRLIRQWLSATYVANEAYQVAGFAELNTDAMQPDLHETYSATQLAALLGRRVDEPVAVRNWIEGQRLSDGGYAGAGGWFRSTYEAVVTLHSVGFAMPASEETSTVSGILRRRGSDGLFSPGVSVRERLMATVDALNTLQAVGMDLSDARLSATRQGIANFLAGANRDEELSDEALLAVQAMALLDRDAASAWRPALLRSWSAVDTGDPPAESRVGVLVTVGDLLGVWGGGVPPGLANYVESRTVPALDAQVRQSHVLPFFSARFALERVRLLQRASVEWADLDRVGDIVERRRVGGGWIGLWLGDVTGANTAHGFLLSSLVGDVNVDADLVVHFLAQDAASLVRSGNGHGAREEIWSLIAAGGQMTAEDDLELRRVTRDTAAEADMDSRQGRLAVASYAFIADSAGWDVDEEMRRKISGVLDRELQAPLLGFEDWAAMERLVDTPGPDVVAAVLGRRVGLGFGIGPLAPVPALNGTLRVVRSLDGGERADVLDLGDIEQFIVSCRAPIGYSMVSAGARNSDVADFESTVAAYWLASELGLDVSERLRIVLPALSASLDG